MSLAAKCEPCSGRPRVMHMIAGLHAGGAERQLAVLIRELSSTYDHSVVTLFPGGIYEVQLRSRAIPVTCVELRGWKEALSGVLRLRRIVSASNPDILHCWMYHANLLGIAACGFSRARQRTLIWSIRTDIRGREIRRQTRILARLGAALSGVPAAIVYNASTSAASHQQLGYLSRRGLVIPNGVDLQGFAPRRHDRELIRAEFGIVPGEIVIGMAARWHPSKDHRALLEAVQILLRRGERVRLLLCGSGMSATNQELVELVRRVGVESNVNLLGERADVPRVMAAWDIACLATFREGFPNAVAEAMACGLPCVATAVADIPAILGATGVTVSEGSAPALADALYAVMKLPPEERMRLGQLARDRVTANYSLASMSRSYAKLYERILRDGNAKGERA